MQALRRQLIIWSAVLLLAVAAAFLLPRLKLLRDAGYVLIGWGQWEIELTAVTLVLIFVIGFILFYAAIRLVGLLLRLPVVMRQRREQARSEAALRSLIQGLRQASEGNWEQAEKQLIEHAAVSGHSLVHYLTAARAAHRRGAAKARDEYLRRAVEEAPDAELAAKLTAAELHLESGDFDRALEALKRLDKIAPANAQVLKLLHQVYTRLGDWEALAKLLPRLRKNKVLMEADLRLLELETYSNRLREAAKGRDAKALRELWERIPENLRQETELQEIYFAAMIEAGAGGEIEAELRRILNRHWHDTLVVLYGAIELEDAAAQLRHAEEWLRRHGNDPVALRVLGKLALRVGDEAKAEDYLRRSLEAGPTVEAYRLLGDLLQRKGAVDEAADCYRRGLMLASEGVIEEVKRHPEG